MTARDDWDTPSGPDLHGWHRTPFSEFVRTRIDQSGFGNIPRAVRDRLIDRPELKVHEHTEGIPVFAVLLYTIWRFTGFLLKAGADGDNGLRACVDRGGMHRDRCLNVDPA